MGIADIITALDRRAINVDEGMTIVTTRIIIEDEVERTVVAGCGILCRHTQLQMPVGGRNG
jgi:hypothetical protein